MEELSKEYLKEEIEFLKKEIYLARIRKDLKREDKKRIELIDAILIMLFVVLFF